MSKEIPTASHSGAQPPIERDPANISHPSKRSAGVMGVVKSLQYTFGEMGPVDATRALLKLNQKDGFDFLCNSVVKPKIWHARLGHHASKL
jgi:hypothetical protein